MTDTFNAAAAVAAAVDAAHTSNGRPGRASVRLSYPTYTGPDGTRQSAAIEITDDASRQHIIELRLDQAALFALMSNAAADAEITHLTRFPERIGKQMKTAAVALDGYGPGVDAQAEEAAAIFRRTGWETVDIRRTNSGRSVVAHRWDAAADGEARP